MDQSDAIRLCSPTICLPLCFDTHFDTFPHFLDDFRGFWTFGVLVVVECARTQCLLMNCPEQTLVWSRAKFVVAFWVGPSFLSNLLQVIFDEISIFVYFALNCWVSKFLNISKYFSVIEIREPASTQGGQSSGLWSATMFDFVIWLRHLLHRIPHLDFSFHYVDNVFVIDLHDVYSTVSFFEIINWSLFLVTCSIGHLRSGHWRSFPSLFGHYLDWILLRIKGSKYLLQEERSKFDNNTICVECYLLVSFWINGLWFFSF